jgi:acetylornithine deacetylase/succinyl-diaminopimelate desuccinylase-like protein
LHMGVKGICYVELSVQGVSHDLHSSAAALAPNAAWRLTWALSTLKDANERILIDGYYDHVREPSPAVAEMLRQLPYEEQIVKDMWGIPDFVAGVTGYAAVKRLYLAPTCTICGLTSGWQGAGTKTVLPAEAKAKIDFRLVPDLSPEIVVDLLRKHLDKHGFQDVQIKQLGGYKPALSDVTAPVVQAAARACQTIHGHEPIKYPLMAASGPMWSLSTYIGVPAVMAGIGYPGSRVHSPNENIPLNNYYEGMRYIAAFLQEFATV